MEQHDELSSNKIRKLSAELLIPEVASNTQEKLRNYFEEYGKGEGLQLFDRIIISLETFQKRIDDSILFTLKHINEPFDDGLGGVQLPPSQEAEKERLKLLSIMHNMSFDERLAYMRDTDGFPRYNLYGPPSGILTIQGIKGNITWSEIERIKTKVEDFKKEKGNNEVQSTEQNIEVRRQVKRDSALLRLKPFSGNNLNGVQIMNDNHYRRMIEYVEYMIDKEELPKTIEPIPKIALTNGFIRYSFYLIHSDLYGTSQIRFYFIDFIHKFFGQFGNVDKTTTKTKFSTPVNSYKADIAKMLIL